MLDFNGVQIGHGTDIKGVGMTIKDAIAAAYGAVFEQSNKCALSETA